MKYILFKQLTQTFLGQAGEIKDKERVEGIPQLSFIIHLTSSL